MPHGREISCSRLSGLFGGSVFLPGHYESRAQRPNRSNRPRWAARVTGFALCRSDLSCHNAHASTQREVGFATVSSSVAWRVTRSVSPYPPTDMRRFVGQCHGRLVVPDVFFQLHPPALQATQSRWLGPVQLFRPRQYRSGAMNQRCTPIRITTLGDAAEVSSKAATRLSGRDTQPGGKLSTIAGCLASVLMGTGSIASQRPASSRASASRRSFLLSRR